MAADGPAADGPHGESEKFGAGVTGTGPPFGDRPRCSDVKGTATLHLAAAGLAGAGILTNGAVRLGCFALAVVGFVAGIVLARRDD